METLLQQTVNGLVVGSVYALIALGYTMVLPDEDKYSNTRNEMLDTLAYALGGRAAEEERAPAGDQGVAPLRLVGGGRRRVVRGIDARLEGTVGLEHALGFGVGAGGRDSLPGREPRGRDGEPGGRPGGGALPHDLRRGEHAGPRPA